MRWHVRFNNKGGGMNQRTEQTASLIKQHIENLLTSPSIRESFEGNKIVAVVSEKEVLVKISAPVVRKKRRENTSQQDAENIKQVKTALKEKRDSFHLYTLLVTLREELERMKLTKMDEQSKNILLPIINDVHECFDKKLLEVKHENTVIDIDR
jgi:hypothetical protein